MELRRLGESPLMVSPLCFGGNVFGWTVDQQNSFKLLDEFTDRGFNFIDTANSYSRWAPGNKGGESETIIGNWLKNSGKRHKIILATKVGSNLSTTQKGLSRRYIMQAVEESLQRLQTDYIDLYQSHYDDPDTAMEETLQAYADLITAGKVRVTGGSNFSAQRFEEALNVSERLKLQRYESLQPEYNLYDRERYEKEYENLVTEKKVGVIPYYSLASGFLSGKYRSDADLIKSARGQGIKKYMNERGFKIINALTAVADGYQATPATIALAWLMARPGITAPIASATSIGQLDALIRATEIQLHPDEIESLNNASAY